MKKYLFILLLLASQKSKAQINGINSIFNQSSYSFYYPDSNNYLLNGCNDYNTLVKQIDSLCPFTTNEFYGNLNNINVDTTLNLMFGLHDQVPWHDTLYTECKFKFNYNNKSSHWYGFYKKSTINNENAFIMIPGSGTFQSLKLAEGDPNNYHNLNGNTRTKCLQYGDLYVYNKINEEYRSFWGMTTPFDYQRLDYDYLTSYTDLNGNHWAANMYIEIIAAVKTLKKKYKNVFIMGLSSGGFPALLCGILGGADGVNCAAGISSWSYNGFQTPNLDQPYFANLLNYNKFD
jgi:dihydrofolate reductase